MSLEHRVGIVVDRHFGPHIKAIAERHHVWVVRSAENDPVIEAFWKNEQASTDQDLLATGITRFIADEDESPEDICLGIIVDVDKHHNEYAHDPAWTEIHVFGVTLCEALQGAFENIGGVYFKETENGFICWRESTSGSHAHEP